VAAPLTRSRVAAAAAVAASGVLAAPTAALAHGTMKVGDFYGGLSQPIFHPESLLPLLAMLLWCVQGPSEIARPRVPLVFALATAAGSALATAGVDLPPAIWVARAGALVLGLLVAARVPSDDRFAAPIAILIGVAAGHASTWPDRADLARPWLYAGGLAMAVVIAWGYLGSLALRFRAFWAQVALRILGSWIATITLLVSALALAAPR
jgi:hydrogenase/urease accessory protein HupE